MAAGKEICDIGREEHVVQTLFQGPPIDRGSQARAAGKRDPLRARLRTRSIFGEFAPIEYRQGKTGLWFLSLSLALDL